MILSKSKIRFTDEETRTIILVICYLYISTAFVKAYNHPIVAGDNYNCRVYFISHSFKRDTDTINNVLIEYVPEQIEYWHIIKDCK